MNTVGDNGYTVVKEKLTNAQITKIRKDLTVKPFVNASYGAEAPAFAIYMESKRKLYLPRYYGIKEYGYPSNFRINEGEEINVEFDASSEIIVINETAGEWNVAGFVANYSWVSQPGVETRCLGQVSP